MEHTKVSVHEKAKILEYYGQGIKVNQIGSLLWVDFGMAVSMMQVNEEAFSTSI